MDKPTARPPGANSGPAHKVGYGSLEPEKTASQFTKMGTRNSSLSISNQMSKVTGAMGDVGKKMLSVASRTQNSTQNGISNPAITDYVADTHRYAAMESSIRDFKQGKDVVADTLRAEIELLRGSLIAIHETLEKQLPKLPENMQNRGIVGDWMARGEAPSVKKVKNQRVKITDGATPQIILLAQTQKYMDTLSSQISQLRQEQDRRDLLISRLQDSLFSILDTVDKKSPSTNANAAAQAVMMSNSNNRSPYNYSNGAIGGQLWNTFFGEENGTGSGGNPLIGSSSKGLAQGNQSISRSYVVNPSGGPGRGGYEEKRDFGDLRRDNYGGTLSRKEQEIPLPHQQLFSLKR